MIFFKRKEQAEIDLSWLGTDMHSHLVPGIDDGSPDLETSLSLIKGLASLGYSKAITTPHILSEVYPNTPDLITNGIEDLRQAAAAQHIEMKLHGAAEYFIDEHFEQLLASRQPLLTLSGNMVLVEFSMVTAPMDLLDILFALQVENYQPVIAHPERYIYLNRKKEFFDDLKSAGCYFQLNLLSLTPHYGTSVQELATYLLKREAYDLAGTDMHSLRHLSALQKLPAAALKRLKDSGKMKNHLL